MTWKELSKRIAEMSPEQKKMDVQVFAVDIDAYIPIDSLEITEGTRQKAAGEPYLVLQVD